MLAGALDSAQASGSALALAAVQASELASERAQAQGLERRPQLETATDTR